MAGSLLQKSLKIEQAYIVNFSAIAVGMPK